jgi:ribonucleoside-diphosphate reductase alpha chain
VLERVRRGSDGLSVNPTAIAQKILGQIYDGVKTTELDELTSQLCASLATVHPDYGTLAARITISNHQKNTDSSFTNVIKQLANQKSKTNESITYINSELLNVVDKHGQEIDDYIKHDRDYLFDYFGFKTLERAYLLRDATGKILERPQYMWMRVALCLWGSIDLQKAFQTYDFMSLKYFTHATPTLFNAGSLKQQLSSCYLIAMDSDSLEGIFKTLTDCAKISKWAGGIGLHVHNIRAKGALIKGTNGRGDGLVPMLRTFNSTARYINQGGKRNGSFAIYLEPWHADVEDFLRLKLNTGTEEERARDLFYALWVSDLFMKRVEADEDWTLFCPSEAPGLDDVYGDAFEELYTRYENEGRGKRKVKAQQLWFQILDTQMETGTPYLLYKDAANAKSNQKNLGTIKSSNLCVAPETYILTDKGQQMISELVDQEVNVWNGEKWSKTTVRKTGENQKLVTVYLSNGAQLTCTPYHKFIINEGYTDRSSIKNAKRVDASELKEGMKLAKWEATIIGGSSEYDFKEPYTHGFFCGDGNEFSNGKNKENEYKRVILCGDKIKLIPNLCLVSIGNEQKNGTIQALVPKDLNPKYDVPINSSIDCRIKWIAGLLDADGGVHKGSNINTDLISLTSINKEFLNNVRLLLLSLGIQSKVIQCKPERKETFPGGKTYDCKALYHIPIGAEAIWKLTQLGMKCNRLTFRIAKPLIKNNQHYTKVISVVDNDRVDDTYCFNEPENHAGVFNGILTGNCSEIIEYSDETECAVCNLASIGLPAYVDPTTKTFDFTKLREVVATIVANLNRVIDINYYPTPETHTSNMRHRPIGLGVQGLADVFAMLRLPWDSEEAADLNQRIFEHLYFAAVEESVRIAHFEEGSYETFKGSPASKGLLQPDLWRVKPLTELDDTLDWNTLRENVKAYGMRNSLLVAPMPTASTSQILSYNEAFEPFTSNIYTRRTLAGEYIVVNRYLLKDLIDRGIWNEDLKQMIIARNGSIQGIDEIPADLQELYKTAWEIKQRTLIDLAAARGAFICQSQSLNLFVADPSYAKLTSMHFYGWKKGLKTGCYYLRTKASVTAQKFTVDPKFLQQDSVPASTQTQQPQTTEPTPIQQSTTATLTKSETRAERLERLAREYEEEQERANKAAASGEGCLMCSG